MRKNSSGLTTGAITAMVICLLVVLIAIAVVIFLLNKGKIFGPKNSDLFNQDSTWELAPNRNYAKKI